jgi:hypothetical protein
METVKIVQSSETEQHQSDAFRPNLIGRKVRGMVSGSRDFSLALNSMRPAKSLRPKHLSPMMITAPTIRVK